MICVYPTDCTDFSTNGNGVLSPLTAAVTETLNGEYELQLTHPIDDGGKWRRLVEGCILRAPVPASMSKVNTVSLGTVLSDTQMQSGMPKEKTRGDNSPFIPSVIDGPASPACDPPRHP